MSVGGLVTLGETMGLVLQAQSGPVRNGEPMSFAIGGSESNVAIAVRRLGLPATWIGRVGGDPIGDLIVRELHAERVEVLATRDPAPTGLMIRWRPTPGRGRVTYYRRDSAGSHLSASDVPAERVASAGVLHVTGITPALGDGPAAAVDAAIAAARAAGVPVSLDLNYRSALWPPEEAASALGRLVPGAEVVFGGLEEASLVAGEPTGVHDGALPVDGAQLRDAAHHAAATLCALGATDAVIKLGDAGCVARIGGETFDLPARRVPVVDTVGCGDAFVAGYLAELLAGAPPAERLATAVAAGAFAATVPGDWEGAPRREDLALVEAGEPVQR
jgi:2-dehydro-3-deoxygluconokinase